MNTNLPDQNVNAIAARSASSPGTKLLGKLAALLLLATPFSPAFALACTEQGTNAAVKTEVLPANVAVPSNSPDGTAIWESRTYTVKVRCWHDWGPNSTERVYFYVNPANQPIATGTQVGVRYNNIVYTQGNGRIDTGFVVPAYQDLNFTMTYSVVVQKSGPSPSSGTSSFGPTGYRVFQLDGEGGINANPSTNLNVVLSGSVRFIGCMADLTFAPSSVIDFGTIMTGGTPGSIIADRSFSLTATRTCTSPYALRVSFRPVTSTPGGSMVDASTYKLTNGVGLNFLDPGASDAVIPMATYQPFVDMGTGLTASKTYKARLVRTTPLTAGDFTVNVVVDLEYY